MTTKKAKASASRIYSNKMEEAVKTFCWLCDQVISLSGLTKHVRGVHKESAVEYREKFGEPKKQLLKLVFHKCGICSKDILLDYLVLVKHLRKAHRIKGAATSEYNSKYMDMIQKVENKRDADEGKHCILLNTSFNSFRNSEASILPALLLTSLLHLFLSRHLFEVHHLHLEELHLLHLALLSHTFPSNISQTCSSASVQYLLETIQVEYAP